MACLDTSFLIDVLDADPDAREVMDDLDREGRRHAVTPITAAELWIGAEQGSVAEYRRTEELLDSLLWLDVTRACTRRAGTIQANRLDESNRLGFNDCLIAATAIEHGRELVTADDDFDRISELRVRSY